MLDIRNISSSKERMDFLIQTSHAEFQKLFNLEGHLNYYQEEADKLHQQLATLENVLRFEYQDKKKQIQTAKDTISQVESFKEVIHQTNKSFEKVIRVSEIDNDIAVAIEQLGNILLFKYEIEGLSNAKHCLRKVHIHVIEKTRSRIHLFKKISYLLDNPIRARIYFKNSESRQDYTFEVVDLHQRPHSGSVVEYSEWLEIITRFYRREIDKVISLSRDQFRELLGFISQRMSPINEITKNFTLGEFIKARSDVYNIHINKLVCEKNFSYHYFRFSSGYMKFEKEFIATLERIYEVVQRRAEDIHAQGFNMVSFYNMNLGDFIYRKRILREVKSVDAQSRVNWGNFLVKKNPELRPIISKLVSEEVRASMGAKELMPGVCMRTLGSGYQSELFMYTIRGESTEHIRKELAEDFRVLREVDERTNILRLSIAPDTSLDVEIVVVTFHATASSFAKAS